MSLRHRVRTINPDAIEDVDFLFVDRLDGQGVRIARWNERKLGAQPASIDDLPDGTALEEEEEEERNAMALLEKDVDTLVETVDKLSRGEAASIPNDTVRRSQVRKRLRDRRNTQPPGGPTGPRNN